jgi:hypothetical protein
MSEPFTITVTGWELALLLFAHFLAGAYATLILTRNSHPRRKLPPRQGELIDL